MNRAAALVFAAGATALAGAAWWRYQRELRGTGLALEDWGLEPEALAPGLGAGLDSIGAALAPAAARIEDWLMLGPTAQQLAELVEQPNLSAFLAMIRVAETGTDGPEAYRMLFGGGRFDTFADHPRKPVTAWLGGRPITSTAAGAYQILARTWDDAVRALGLPDFSPRNQDIAAAWLIRRRGALADVLAGRFEQAVRKAALEWASLPGSPYGQPQRSLAAVRRLYANAGGTFA